MSENLLPGLIACLTVLPATFFAVTGRSRGPLFQILCGIALAGPLIWSIMRSAHGWQTDLGTALWFTISATMFSFLALCMASRQARHLGGVVLPYMSILALTALAWDLASRGEAVMTISNWVVFHILVSVMTYAVVTLAACAACAGLLQEKALKNKNTSAYTDRLPSLSYCNDIQFRLLALGELVLGTGLSSGVASSVAEGGPVFQFDHKTLFAMAAFVIIGILLVWQPRSGVGGKQVMRVILAAYLLLTLAYPGVKFVTSVLLA